MKNKIKKVCSIGVVMSSLLGSIWMLPNTTVQANNDEFMQEFAEPSMENRPRTRWWVPGSQMTTEEIEAEIKSMVEAGFGGAEIVPVATDGEGGSSIDWGTEEWNKKSKHILQVANTYGFTIDFTMTPAWPLALPTITDVNNPNQGAQMELDGAYQDGITKETPFDGEIPKSQEAIEDAQKVNGNLELVAVTVAKYEDKENKVLDFDSVKEIEYTKVEQTYEAKWVPEDDGEYVVFGWWQHPSGNQKYGNNQVDHYSKSGAQMIIEYWENNLIPYYGEDFNAVESLFIDSLEFETHLDWTYDLLEGFENTNSYNIAAYLPAIYDNDAIGNYMGDPVADFTFNHNTEAVNNDFKEYLTTLYIENHIQPLQEFCNSHDVTLRYQTSYGKNLETARTAMHVDIPETETLYGDDMLDFYRLQAGAVHLTDKPIYSIETAAEWTEQWNEKDPETGEWKTRGNGEKDSGNYQQTFQSMAWHTQRAFAGGVNHVVFHGYAYNGQYDGSGNEQGYIPGVQWPGFDGFSASTWSNSWGERQPNWNHARNYTDFIARNQYVLRQGTAKIDLAIYNQSYYETIDFIGSQKIYDDNSLLEQSGYTYDFVSPAGFDLETATVQNGCLDSEGPSYQAVIINQQEALPEETVLQFIEYAKQGLSIIIVGNSPIQSSFLMDSDINSMMNTLLEEETVMQVATVAEVPETLQKLRITPAVSYEKPETLLNVHRQLEDMELYYLYNYGNVDSYREVPEISDIQTTVTLKGTGKPYLLDTWTGEKQPIAKYTVQEDSVTVDVDIAGNESILIALMDAPGQQYVTSATVDAKYNEDEQLYVIGSNITDTVVTNTGSEEVVLEASQEPFVLIDWNMTIESWTPGDTPTDTKKTKHTIGTVASLVPWNQISGFENVSGIGTYQTTFQLDKGWENGAGAYLDLGDVTDTFTLKINDIEIPTNQIDTKIDIGKYAKAGENTIEIEVASTLLNAVLAVNTEDGRDTDAYGLLTDVTITPYQYHVLGQTEQTIIDEEVKRDPVNKEKSPLVQTGDMATILPYTIIGLTTLVISVYIIKKRV